jgi:hypothetical protein
LFMYASNSKSVVNSTIKGIFTKSQTTTITIPMAPQAQTPTAQATNETAAGIEV